MHHEQAGENSEDQDDVANNHPGVEITNLDFVVAEVGLVIV